jgi:hypothetical protein
VEGRGAALDANVVRRNFEQMPGVSRVVAKASDEKRCAFEVECLPGRSIRGDLARAVVEAGWNLTELRPAAFSLEEIFLQLTAADQESPVGGAK